MRRFSTIVPLLMLAAIGAAMVLLGPRALRSYTLAEQSARVILAREQIADDDILRRIDEAVAAIAESVGPSVVHMDTAGERRSGSGSSGAGWIFDDRGHVVTNAHVVLGSRRIVVEFADGVVTSASLVGSDVYTDIAVIRVDRDPAELIPARLSEMRLPRIGDRVFAFGSPFGFKFSMSEGIVSGLGRRAPGTSIPGGYTNYIQTDAAVNPGNSGGPLVNTEGRVVGMNVAIATSRSIGSTPEDAGGDSAGISFAIPLGTIEPIVDQLIRFGEVSRGYMGITFGGEDQPLERVSGPDGRVLTGVRVTAIESGGPSDEAGLRAEDVIVSVQGSPIVGRDSLSSLVSSGRPGDPISVRIWRNGEFLERTVVLEPIRPQVLAQRLQEPTQVRLGAILAPVQSGEAMEIIQIWDGLPAATAGLEVGDRIDRINGQPFDGPFEFYVDAANAGLLTGQTVVFGVESADGSRREVPVSLYP